MLGEPHSRLPLLLGVLSQAEVVEEQVGPEGGHSLEVDPADLALVETAQGPGWGALLGSNGGLTSTIQSHSSTTSTVQSHPPTRLWLPGFLHFAGFPFIYWRDGDAGGERVLQPPGGGGAGGEGRVLEGESSLDQPV